MNKKFSTLMTTGLLLSGALFCNVNAESVGSQAFKAAIKKGSVLVFGEDKNYTLTEAVDLSSEETNKFIIIDTDGVTLDGAGKTFTGRIIVTAEGVTIKNLKIVNTPVTGIGGYWEKTAITAFADKLTVTGNTITATEVENALANGIVLYPQSNTVAYTVERNTLKELNATVGYDKGTWYSSAIQVYKNTKLESKEGDPVNSIIKKTEATQVDDEEEAITIDAPKGYGDVATGTPSIEYWSIINNNSFEKCAADLIVRNGNELDDTYKVEFAQITNIPVPATKATPINMLATAAALTDVIKASTLNTAIEVKGATAAEVAALLTNTTSVPTAVAKELADKTVVINTSSEAGVATGSVALGDVSVEGAIKVDITSDGTTTAYVSEVAEAIESGKNYILMTTDGKALSGKADGTVEAKEFPQVFDYDVPAFVNNYEAFQWTITLDKKLGIARFVNVATEKELMCDGVTNGVAIAKLTNDALTPDAIEFKQKDGTTAATINGASDKSFAAANAVALKKALTSEELQLIYGASFNAVIKRTEGNKDLENNPFVGNLQPVQWKNNNVNNGYVLEAASDDAQSFMLLNGEGKLIVMQTTDEYATANVDGVKDYAYRIVAITPRELGTALKTTATKGKYASLFSIYAPYSFVAGKEEKVDWIQVTGDQRNGSSVYNTYKLGSISLSGKYTLAAENIYAPDYLEPITIKLTKFTTIDVKKLLKNPTFYTVTNKNTKKVYAATEANFGKVLGLDSKGQVAYMKTSEALVGYPETQWAITTTDGATLTFKNRETPAAVEDNTDEDSFFSLKANELYKIDGEDNLYAVVTTPGAAAIDTIEIAPLALTDWASSDGYKRYDANWLKDQLFYMGSYSSVRGMAYVTENHKNNHQVGMEKEQDDATAWHVAPLMYEAKDVWGNQEYLTPDTIRIENVLGYWDAAANNNKGAFKNTKEDDVDANDTYLKVVAYSFKNDANNEYLAYDEARNRYATGKEDSKEGFKELTDANYFALKIMGGDSTKYNLVVVKPELNTKGYTDDLYETSLENKKMYSGDSADKGLLNNDISMYDQTENDLFTVEAKEAYEYLKLTQGEVIKLYREEYDSESNVLYEKAGFLGIGNAVENTKINPALYVDTVYVDREGNNRWEYLLGVNITRIDTTYKCDVPAHDVLFHKADTTKGRFLVNFADSAIVAEGKEDIHVNKYMYSDSEGDWAKLGFVPGFRTDDTLHIYNGETKKLDKIEVGTSAPQLVKFAFRIVNHDTKAFIIETGYKALDENAEVETRGFLRYDNGVVYVTDKEENAEVFMANLDENRDPVANEGINASEVSVIAGNGNVTIKGAEGKTVVIANVLGQTIANTVLSSDNATISAPAGIVVVAVEGEAAVKAIVK